ncbi:hypothetical protein [Parafrankia discariae]|uniref:hypothetical protein n=1 Tax=Parafrankia discariae TaxID=365528 RepID=UPI00037F233C|nr:hypothetical protein [Parafrankia discariae]
MPRISPDDPRDLGGDIAGPGGPHDRNAVVVDTSNAVLLAGLDVAIAHNASDGRDFVTLLVEGRINRTQDRTRVLWLADEDGLAALVTEIEALMRRAGPAWLDRYRAAKARRIADMKAAGTWRPLPLDPGR